MGCGTTSEPESQVAGLQAAAATLLAEQALQQQISRQAAAAAAQAEEAIQRQIRRLDEELAAAKAQAKEHCAATKKEHSAAAKQLSIMTAKCTELQASLLKSEESLEQCRGELKQAKTEHNILEGKRRRVLDEKLALEVRACVANG